MPRYPRVKGAYCTYHVIQRGVERRPIFLDDRDRLRFLDTLVRMKGKYNYKIYGYCLMGNHTHLIIDSHGSDISIIMKSVNVSYAMYFNRKYRRCGHLFQDRFKSEVVDDDRYLLELSRYIHLNPVRAGMVRNAADYTWSSYRTYIGLAEDHGGLLDGGLLMRQLSADVTKARRYYIDYMGRGDTAVHDQNGTSRVPMDFADWSESLPVLHGADWVAELLQKVARDNGVTVADIIQKRGSHQGIRNRAITEARQKTNLGLREIGELFGGLSESAVSRILKG